MNNEGKWEDEEKWIFDQKDDKVKGSELEYIKAIKYFTLFFVIFSLIIFLLINYLK